jgi:hypothetical protein
MNTKRGAILSLVALGRITPAEAESLLSVCPDHDEIITRFAICLAVVWMVLPDLHALFTGFAHALMALMPRHVAVAHPALACFTNWIGGVL